jgi:hypothetical protein
MTATTSDHSYLRVSQWFKLVYTLHTKNLTNTSYAWPHGSHIRQPSAKSLLSWNRGSAPGMKSWLSAIARPSRHPGLPHSPSTKPPRSRARTVRQSSYWATRFTGPHKTRHAVSTNQSLSIGAKMTWSSVNTGGATTLEPWNSHDPLSTPSFQVIHFPLFAPLGHINKHKHKPLLHISKITL